MLSKRMTVIRACSQPSSDLTRPPRVKAAVQAWRYRKVLGERISALPHVARTSTFVTMETVKDR